MRAGFPRPQRFRARGDLHALQTLNFVTCSPYHRYTQKAPSVQQVGSDAGGIMHAVGCHMLLCGDSTFIGTQHTI